MTDSRAAAGGHGSRTTGLVGGCLAAGAMTLALVSIALGAGSTGGDWGVLGAAYELAGLVVAASVLLVAAMICVGLGWSGVARSGRAGGSLSAITAGVWFAQPALLGLGAVFGILGIDAALPVFGGLVGLAFLVALILSAVAVGHPAMKGTAATVGRVALIVGLVGLVIGPFAMASGVAALGTLISLLALAGLGVGLAATGVAQRGLT